MEVESLWKKMKRPRLLALIGPSGAGKSSFLRAGLLSTLPVGWRVILSTPGGRPFSALAQALLPSFAGDMEAIQSFMDFERGTAVPLLSKWRHGAEHALVIVDQFEELFTLNPPEVQQEFATLLGRLVLEADVHVLLSLRDDFLFQCQNHDALSPVFSELTPLGTLSPSALRRALVQPALACGYRFEDEALVEEMVSEVSRERGALPLLAFAASRLWEKRDRESGLLTREAYSEIGGVGGALAQHAEETLSRIGEERAPLVRELFRNLVTAQGTRASREVEELLSIFSKEEERKAAEDVLRELVASRLLTSYESSVEIIHESLLSSWPRLVRWQAQDTEGALLRDQLRQAAQAWQDRGRPEDLLWTGKPYRELSLWRESYPGGLSSTEEAFAQAAAKLAGRRRRRRRIAVVSAFVALLAVVAVVLVSRQQAVASALRAEASKLLALVQLELESYPTAAVAYALKSIELSDTREARLLALRALQRGPTAIVAPDRDFRQGGVEFFYTAFSPSGEWLALGGARQVEVLNRDGRAPLVLEDWPTGPRYVSTVRVGFGAGDTLVTNQAGDVRALTVPGGRELWRAQGDQGGNLLYVRGNRFFTLTRVGPQLAVRTWTLDTGKSRFVGMMEPVGFEGDIPRHLADVDPRGGQLAYARGRRIYLRSLERWASPPRLLAEHAAALVGVAFGPDGEQVAVSDASGEIRIWRTAGEATRPIHILRGEMTPSLAWDPTARWLAAWSQPPNETKPVRLFDLTGPPGAAPLLLRRTGVPYWLSCAFDPSGRWLVTAHRIDAAFWPVGEGHPRDLADQRGLEAFTPDGEALVTRSEDGALELVPLSAGADKARRIGPPGFERGLVDWQWRCVVKRIPGGLKVAALPGGPEHELRGFSKDARVTRFACAPDGRRVAAAADFGPSQDKVIRVWDLESGNVQVLGPMPGAGEGFEGGVSTLDFLGRDRLLASGPALVLFDLRDGTARVLDTKRIEGIELSHGGDFGIGRYPISQSPYRAELVRFSLEEKGPQILSSHGNTVGSADLDPSDSLIASGNYDGTVRIGPVSGGEPHYYFGHEGLADVGFSPNGKWLVSFGVDEKTIRLWPVPDAFKPPFHTLPREELTARLRALTNLRAVPDPGSPTGYKIEVGPFPGWAKPPEW
jgi:WD40 repeat protein